jgi:hypothetical protein
MQPTIYFPTPVERPSAVRVGWVRDAWRLPCPTNPRPTTRSFDFGDEVYPDENRGS